MNYSIFMWEIVSFIFVSLFSTIVYLYFDYQESNKFYKLFIPKNDSIWERIKVLLAPTLLIMVFEILLVDLTPNFMFSKLISIIIMVITNPLLFVINFKFSKWDMLINNVLTTVSCALIGLIISTLLLNLPELSDGIIYISTVGIVMVIAFYIIATFYQTNDFIFIDPITKKSNVKKDH